LALAFASYFGINLLFTLRLRRVLAREGVKTSLGKTLLAQYAGMLTSDVTPGRSGYVLTPVYLSDQKVPAPISLSAILGIQSIEFLAKVIGASLALVFLFETAVVPITTELVILGVAGIGLMLAGAILLILMSTSEKVIRFVQRIAGHRLLVKITGKLLGKLEEYAANAKKTRKAFPEISLLTLACWILKGFEWFFLSLALGLVFPFNPVIMWLAMFLIHPLVTALGFVPITPAGLGAQEWGIVLVFGLLGIGPVPAVTFALLARGLLLIEDLAGVPQIVKTTSGLAFSRKKPEPIAPAPTA
jgi:glycosyltransferase 2 family protein